MFDVKGMIKELKEERNDHYAVIDEHRNRVKEIDVTIANVVEKSGLVPCAACNTRGRFFKKVDGKETNVRVCTDCNGVGYVDAQPLNKKSK